MITVETRSDIFREAIEKCLPMMRLMIPRWCDKLLVRTLDVDHEKCYDAEVNIDLEYCHATIRLYPCWLIGNDEARLESMRHEMFHLVTAGAIDHAAMLLENAKIDPILLKDYRTRVEQTMQLLCRNYRHKDETPTNA